MPDGAAAGAMTVRAAVCHAFGEPLRVEALTLAPPRPGEVRVRIGAVAICHSDISLGDGAWGGPLPAVWGHEAAGRVIDAGAGADLAPGTPVIVTLIRSCGRCACCVTGHPVHCLEPGDAPGHPLTDADGAPVAAGVSTGAFAEAVTVHASQVAPVPEAMPTDAASLLACGVVTGVGAAVYGARVRPGQDVVVIGAGGVGLNAVQGARIAGARRIVAVDLHEDKLAAAREFGATDGVTGAEPWVAARAILGRGADAVLVSVGVAGAYETAWRYLAPGGRLVAVGMPPSGVTAAVEPLEVAFRGAVWVGSRMGDVVLSRDIPWMVDLWSQGRLLLEPLITGRWPLERINEAIADTRTGRARRNVIVL